MEPKQKTEQDTTVGKEHFAPKAEYLDEKLLAYSQTDAYPFHMPGHKRQSMGNWTGEEIDITEITGFDNLHHPEGIDLLPANIALAGTEVSLVNAMSRETILKQVLARNRQDYDCIIIDCMPSLGMLTINALAAAERVIIPVQAHYLSAKGLEQLLQTIAKVRRQMNPKLKIDGILMTMVDGRTNNAKEITTLIRETYGGKIKVFETAIPHSVRAAEASLTGKSIFEYDPGGKMAQAYRALTKEVLQLEKQRQKAKSDLLR